MPDLPIWQLAHFGLPWHNRGKCDMDGKSIQCWSKASQHVPIYLQPFTSYPLHLTLPLVVIPLDDLRDF